MSHIADNGQPTWGNMAEVGRIWFHQHEIMIKLWGEENPEKQDRQWSDNQLRL